MWDYDLVTFPRPSGAETEVIYTTWDLPVTARPHDVRIGLDGMIYFNHFNDNLFGQLNPETGEVVEYRWPYLREAGSHVPTGSRTLMGPDEDNKFYIHNFNHGDFTAILDPATGEIEVVEGPGGGSQVEVRSMHVDGYAWKTGPFGTLHRIDFSTHPVTFETIEGPRSLAAYDIGADTRNNIYGAGRASTYVWRLDAETLEVSYYDIPEEPRGVGGLGGGMRRGVTDAQDRFWWGGFDGNFIGVLDPRLPEGEEMTLYEVPFPWFQPYHAAYDNDGYTWSGGIAADRVARFHVESGQWNFYLLPFEANIRDIQVQYAEEGELSGLWIGHTHTGQITFVEPLSP
jgi:streptogramin lyase